VSVDPAPMTITASSETLPYGSSPQPVTPSYEGLVNGDTAASLTTQPTCSTVPAGADVGSYPTTCSGAEDPNYDIGYAPGSLTVTQAPLTITASSQSSVYGSAPSAVTPSYEGFVNGDTVASLTTEPSCSTTAGADSNVGARSRRCTRGSSTETRPDAPTTPPDCSTDVDATSPPAEYPSTCDGAVAANYAIDYVNGVVTVLRAPTQLSVSATRSSGVFSATLTRSDSGAAIAGARITFGGSNGATICTADTRADGIATCTAPASARRFITLGYSATFAGDAMYAPATATAGTNSRIPV
jgi:hypothetical protein